ncbi:MAG: GNAT family N-acetyltransferase [Fuerstiella sp.]
MSPLIINCQDRELRFCSDGRNTFRSFYVVTEGGDFEAIGFQCRILVTLQPDRTVQIMKAIAAEASQPSAASERNHKVQSAEWSRLLAAAFQELKDETVLATYVLDDESDEHWTAALEASQLTQQGTIYQFQRSNSLVSESNQRAQHGLLVQSFCANFLARSNVQISADNDDTTAAVLAEQVIRLLEDTIPNSDDCLLPSKVQPKDVLTLFACNPGPLTVLLVTGKHGATGILVGDESDGPNRGHIEYLGVHSDHRRQSVGSILVEEFQARIPNSDLSVAVHAGNTASSFFFQTHNFCRSQQYRLWTRDMGEH